MSATITVSTKDKWNLWVNESASGEIRIADNKLALPFTKIQHIGSGSESSQVIARWRFGQTQTTSDQSANGHTASIPNGVPVEIIDDGAFSHSKNGFMTVNEDDDFHYPDSLSSKYLSLWFKSNLLDYSNYFGFIAGCHIGVGDGQIAYAIIIDSDNKIKSVFRSSGTSLKIAPIGGDVYIDNNWHHALLLFDSDGSSYKNMLVIDNDFGDNVFNSDIITPVSGPFQFDILSSSFSSQFGFSGTVDEIVLSAYSGSHSIDLSQHRFEQNVFLSPVFDTCRNDSILSTIIADFQSNSNSSVLFSFRADNNIFDQRSSTPAWSGFSQIGQVVSREEFSASENNLFIKGRYQQVRVKLKPSDKYNSDALQTECPFLESIELNTSTSEIVTGPYNKAIENGTIIGQIYNFSGTKKIDKVSLNLQVNTSNKKLLIIGKRGTAAFPASVFQDYRESWVFQPIIHWSLPWKTSGMTLQNTFQYTYYTDSSDAYQNAPFLKYFIFLDQSGEYDIWAYGHSHDPGIIWSIDDDTTHLRYAEIGHSVSHGTLRPSWSKIGTIYSDTGGVHTFTVYLSSDPVILLDQFLFTQNKSFQEEIDQQGEDGYYSPVQNSQSPFVLMLRLRSLLNERLSSLSDPVLNSNDSVTSWLLSSEVNVLGKSNFHIQNDPVQSGVNFTDGVSLEFSQIGGGYNDCAAWSVSFANTSAGDVFSSKNYGQSYTVES